IPTVVPSLMPSGIPSGDPSNRPTYEPTYLPTVVPTDFPTVSPTRFPTIMPSCFPTNAPSMIPTAIPSFIPSASPTNGPTSEPSYEPTFCPTVTPSNFPTVSPSRIPTVFPTALPTSAPSMIPTVVPSLMPSGIPSGDPSNRPTYEPTYLPTVVPTDFPTVSPSELPTIVPSCFPTNDPSVIPTAIPTIMPTGRPTFLPSLVPTNMPTLAPRTIPTVWPTCLPTDDPTRVPTLMPTMVPSCQPTSSPTAMPTRAPTLMPTSIPTNFPTLDPTQLPTSWPSSLPTNHPSFRPTLSPTIMPSGKPSLIATLTPSVMPSGLPTYPPTYWPSDLPSPGPSYSPTWRPSISPSGRPTWMPTYVPTNGPSIIPTTMSSISQMPTQTRRANASITFSFADSRAVNFKRVVYDEKSDTIVVSTDSRLLLIDQATGGIMTGSAIISLADGSEPTIIDMFISDQFLYVMSKVKSTVNPFYFVTTIMRYNIIDGTVSSFGVNGYYFSHSAVILASNTLLSPGNSRADGVCFSRFGIDTFTAMNNPCYFTPGRTYTFAHAIECQLPFLCFGGNTNTGIMVILKVNVNSLDSLTVGAKAYEVQRQDPQSGDTHQLVRLASGAYGDRIITLGQLYRSTEGVSYLCASFQGLTINWAQQMAVSATDVLSVMLPNGDGVVLLCAGYDHFSGAPGRQLVLIKLDENTGEVLSAIKIISLFPVQGDCRFGKIGTRGILITASLLQNDGTQSGLIFFLDLETMTASSLPTDVRFMPFNTTAVLNAKPASLQINVNSLSLGYWTGPRVTSWSMVTTPLAIQQFSKIFSLAAPSFFPTFLPSQLPTRAPSRTPTRLPTRSPAWIQPTRRPVTPAPVLAKNETHMPTLAGSPTSGPSGELSDSSPPTKSPNTRKPSFRPSSAPLTRRPSRAPYAPSGQPSQLSIVLSEIPTLSPTELLTLLPTLLNTTQNEASGEGSGFRAGMIALGAVVMLLVCLLIYWKYRNKKKGSVSPGEKELIDWIQSSIHDIEEGNDGHQIMMDHFLKNLPEAMRHVFSQSEISSFILFIRTIENYVSAFSLNDANKVVPIDEKGLLLFNKETEKSSIDRIYTKGSLASRVLYQCVDNRYQLLQEKLKKEHEKIADDILDEIIANVIATSDRASRRQSVSSEGDNIESLFQKWMEEFVYDDEQEEEERWTEETIVGVVEYSRPEGGKDQEKALGDELTRVLSDNKITLHYHKEIKGGVDVRRASPV
nr:hypothetical protein [Gammaproteobacteria bacterium]